MESELYNFIFVWSTVFASLCYSHGIGRVFPQGKIRFLAILPVICLFLLLPLMLNSVHLAGISSFFISWLASFKLLLFATGKGPLSSSPFLPLSRFIAFACLPIKAREVKEPIREGQFLADKSLSHPVSEKLTRVQETKNQCVAYHGLIGPIKWRHSVSEFSSKENQKSPLNYVTKLMLLGMCIRMYEYKVFLHPKMVYFLYALHIYFTMELLLALLGAAARLAFGVELEPQFNEPCLSTSLQDFWGRRWNLMVTNILRQTVFDPMRSVSAPFLGRRAASLAAVLATFLVSGLMHELVLYSLGRLKPTGEITCFFLLHGACVAAETEMKRGLRGKFQLPGIVSGPLAIGFVIYSSFWLFFPPLLRGEVDVKACKESLAFIEFVKHARMVGPGNFTCPYSSPTAGPK